MPAESKAQRRWAFWAEKTGKLTPSQAEHFESTDPKGLPERVGMAHGGMTCPSCGYAMGGEVDYDDEWTESEDEKMEEAANEPFAYYLAHRKRG